jgi:hypothetical protein
MNNKCNLDNLLAAHRANTRIKATKKIQFLGVRGFDVYNISSEFVFEGERYIAGRVEKRDSEISTVRFFKRIGTDIYEATREVIENLQDPFVEIIDGKLLVGGTQIHPDATGKITSWRTVFYQGTSFRDLRIIIEAPLKMKDVRIAKGAQYYMMSRPQGGDAKWGKIGFDSSDALYHITTEFIQKAPLLDDLFGDECWGGANQVHVLKNGMIGVLGHVARMSQGDIRHYYGMTFALDPISRKRTPMKIICERSDFEQGAAKRLDLIDVVFVGGLVRNHDGTATLYTGLSDAEAHYAIIEDPFVEYEELNT